MEGRRCCSGRLEVKGKGKRGQWASGWLSRTGRRNGQEWGLGAARPACCGESIVHRYEGRDESSVQATKRAKDDVPKSNGDRGCQAGEI